MNSTVELALKTAIRETRERIDNIQTDIYILTRVDGLTIFLDRLYSNEQFSKRELEKLEAATNALGIEYHKIPEIDWKARTSEGFNPVRPLEGLETALEEARTRIVELENEAGRHNMCVDVDDIEKLKAELEATKLSEELLTKRVQTRTRLLRLKMADIRRLAEELDGLRQIEKKLEAAQEDILELEKTRLQLREALAFYAEPKNWTSYWSDEVSGPHIDQPITKKDRGFLARKALEIKHD